MTEEKDTKGTATGSVEEVLPNSLFRVRLAEGGDLVLAYLAGKMRLHRIRAEIQEAGNFLVGFAFGQELKNFLLACREQIVGILQSALLHVAHIVFQ